MVRAYVHTLGSGDDQRSDGPGTASYYEPEPVSRQVQKRLTSREAEQLIARYQAGATVCELAEEFKCNRTTVRRKLKDAEVLLRRTPPQPRHRSMRWSGCTSQGCRWSGSASESDSRHTRC
ncbi:helix-turn-helix domain-containing protein [Psychromicrobium xiongbiense]|uniref:helix-turn-helix domain-containing protein n=1 Tax=Psychromicrobium xiongbiense TaxID=3051184 RepID=UPI003B221A67